MKRPVKYALILIGLALVAFGGYMYALAQGHRDPLPGDVGDPMHVSLAAYERVTGTGVLRCGYYDWPPYIKKGDDLARPTGPVVELLEQMGQVLGLNIEFVESALGRQQQDLAESRIDAQCFDAPHSPVYFRSFDLGSPLFSVPMYLYTAKQGGLPAGTSITKEDIAIAHAEGDGANAIKARFNPKAKLVPVAVSGGLTHLLSFVAKGDADAVIADPLAVAAFNTANEKTPLSQVSNTVVYQQVFYILTNKGDPALRAMIDEALTQLRVQNRYSRLFAAIDSSHQLHLPAPPLVPVSAAPHRH